MFGACILFCCCFFPRVHTVHVWGNRLDRGSPFSSVACESSAFAWVRYSLASAISRASSRQQTPQAQRARGSFHGCRKGVSRASRNSLFSLICHFWLRLCWGVVSAGVSCRSFGFGPGGRVPDLLMIASHKRNKRNFKRGGNKSRKNLLILLGFLMHCFIKL